MSIWPSDNSFRGVAPCIWGPLSDSIGRRSVLLFTLITYIGANIGLALTINTSMLIAFRALQAFGSASTIAIGAGVIQDMCPRETKGSYMGWYSGVRQVSTAMGPIIGGLLAGFLGFRSIFWFLTIFAAAVVVIVALVLPETLRSIAGNGGLSTDSLLYRPWIANPFPKTSNVEVAETRSEMSRNKLKPSAFLGPLKLCIRRDVLLTCIFGGCVFTVSVATSS